MPRRSQLLPYLQSVKGRKLSYVRRVPSELQEFMDNRRYIRRPLDVNTTDCADPKLLMAWAAVHEDVEAQFAAAIAAKEAAAAGIQQVSVLSPKDIAGIGAEPWRQLREAAASGQVGPELQARVEQGLQIALESLVAAAISGSDAPKAETRQQESLCTLHPMVFQS